MRNIVLFLGLFIIFGCTPDKEDVIREWNEKGWKKVGTHGMEREFIRQGTLISEQAQAIEASWIEKGERKTKLYKQDSHYYLALRFFCSDGDEFAIVMKKRK
jgi:hypothetical protein